MWKDRGSSLRDILEEALRVEVQSPWMSNLQHCREAQCIGAVSFSLS